MGKNLPISHYVSLRTDKSNIDADDYSLSVSPVDIWIFPVGCSPPPEFLFMPASEFTPQITEVNCYC
jgi:hypothetical protein